MIGTSASLLTSLVIGSRLLLPTIFSGSRTTFRTLCRLLLARSTQPPLAVGVFGDWGAGKSFFIQRIRTRIEEMKNEAARSAAGLGYCEQVVQVSFNAWHYLDADLWASIANRLYRAVAGGPSGAQRARSQIFEQLASTSETRELAAAEREQAEKELEELTKRLNDRESTLVKVRDHRLTASDAVDVLDLATSEKPVIAKEEGSKDKELRELVADAQFGRGLVRSLWQRTSGWAKLTALAAAALAAAAIVLLATTGWLAPLVTLISSVGAAAAAWVSGFKDAFRQVRTQAEQAQSLLEETTSKLRSDVDALKNQLDAAQVKQETAEATLDQIRRGGFVRRYLDERVRSAPYRDRLGLVNLVREDLEQLTEWLDPKSAESLDAKIDRIVLYVDDLDRCPPSRVVEVLQAVHLLLAFPLFVVVVAVDHRWLLTSLELHYQELLGTEEEARSGLRKEWELTPTNYLEKIFQIPLALQPMSPEGYQRLVGSLAGVRRPPDVTGQSTKRNEDAGADRTAHDSAPGVSSAPSQPSEPREPIVVFREAVAGSVLRLDFCVGGGRLVLITTEGVWRWDRGRTGLTRELEERITAAASSPDGETVAVVSADGLVHAIDLRSREKWDAPTPGQIAEVAVGSLDRVMALTEVGVVSLRPQADKNPPFPGKRTLSVTANRVAVLENGTLALADDQSLADGQSADKRPADCYTISSQGEILVRYGNDLQSWMLGSTDDAGDLRSTQLGEHFESVSLRTKVVRSSEAWWLATSSGSIYSWSPEEADPVKIPFHLGGDNVAADAAAPLVVCWGSDGFEVADRKMLHYRATDVAVDAAAVSPLGSLIATTGAGEVILWRVTGSEKPETPEQLELEPEEADFLAALGPLVPTPRMAKRLFNVYRLLRASAVGRTRLADPSTHDYRAALLLLVLVVAKPAQGAVILDTLESRKEGTWASLIKELQEGAKDDLRDTLDHLLTLSTEPTPSSVKIFAEWVEPVRRYLIHPQ